MDLICVQVSYSDNSKLKEQLKTLKKNTIIACTACNYKKENNKKPSNYLITLLRIYLQKFFLFMIIKKGYYWLYIYNPIILSSVLIKKEFPSLPLPKDANKNIIFMFLDNHKEY